MNYASIGWDSDYGFSRYDAECSAADRFSALVDDMMSEPAFIEAWFADYELDLDASAELVMAMASSLKRLNWEKISFVLAYFNDSAAGLCDDLADFFNYYGCDQKTAAELWLVITEIGTPMAWASLREYCEEELRNR